MMMRTSEKTSINTEVTPVYQKILVPLDGSELAERSLKHALAIAGETKLAQIILLTVVGPITLGLFFPAEGFDCGGGVMAGDLLDELRKEQEEKAKKYLNTIITRLSGKDYKLYPIIIIGRSSNEIVRFADSNNIDLIIMSTHGRSGIGRWVMGSVTDSVLHSSRVPVLVIPPQQS